MPSALEFNFQSVMSEFTGVARRWWSIDYLTNIQINFLALSDGEM